MSAISRVITLTKHVELDLTGDETSWAHHEYGERGAGIIKRIQVKPGVSKGGQTVVVSATNRIRPYWYQYRHSFNRRYPEEGMNAEGPAELKTFIYHMKGHVRSCVHNEGEAEEFVLDICPHITWDNYFSGTISISN